MPGCLFSLSPGSKCLQNEEKNKFTSENCAQPHLEERELTFTEHPPCAWDHAKSLHMSSIHTATLRADIIICLLQRRKPKFSQVESLAQGQTACNLSVETRALTQCIVRLLSAVVSARVSPVKHCGIYDIITVLLL